MLTQFIIWTGMIVQFIKKKKKTLTKSIPLINMLFFSWFIKELIDSDLD